MSTHQSTKYGEFTLFGGIIALSCFFMPWTGISPAYRHFVTLPFTSISSLIAIAFIASVVIISISYYTLNRQTPWKSRIPILISSGIGLGILLNLKFIYIIQIDQTGINFSGFWSTPFNGPGFWGAVSGFAIAAVGALLIRAEEAKEQSKVSVKERQLGSIVLAGGIVALLCFFMPWEGIGNLSTWSGFKLVSMQPSLAIVFAASIIIIVGSVYTLIRETWKLRVPVLVSIGIGAGILFVYYILFYFNQIFHANISGEKEIIRRSIKFGSCGTVLGYIIAAFGMFCSWDVFDQENNKDVQVEVSEP